MASDARDEMRDLLGLSLLRLEGVLQEIVHQLPQARRVERELPFFCSTVVSRPAFS
mgnify:CR=1 FL=1